MVEVLGSREFSALLGANMAVTRKVLKATTTRLMEAESSLLGLYLAPTARDRTKAANAVGPHRRAGVGSFE
ncbi:hypothetical protein OAV42_03580 [Ilumatobacter sp.]|uniref:hypothetical protein n=1 Tax=uncultured Ilumatobacter sp. TaxID=879968 RepID=UPI00374F154E|nr:hypothetical protein [Ilumatobacter sp.]